MRWWRNVLVATALALLGAACSVTGPPKDNTAMSYLALGDSYTIGEGVPDAGRWPVQLATALRKEGVDLADPRILAATGWTTDELSAAIDATEPLGSFDFVSLLIGVNNQYRGRSVTEYRDQFTALLERTIGFAGGRAVPATLHAKAVHLRAGDATDKDGAFDSTWPTPPLAEKDYCAGLRAQFGDKDKAVTKP